MVSGRRIVTSRGRRSSALSVGCRFACSSRCGGRVGGHVERALIAPCEAQRDRREVRSRVGGMLAGAHGLAPVGSIDANISFGLPAATHSVGECSLLIAHQGEGRTAVTGIGVEQPHRSCPQRPSLAGRRASTDDCIRLQAARRPATAHRTCCGCLDRRRERATIACPLVEGLPKTSPSRRW